MQSLLRALVLVLLFLTSATAIADADPRVSLETARQTALARVPGKVVGEKLKQPGKKRPHPTWNIKIEAKTGRVKVIVDGETGKILEVKHKANDD
jgi:uncharacterized membrane protein YkoI